MLNFSFKDWMALREDESRPTKPKGMKKNNWKQTLPAGVRCCDKDLSKDYKGHIKHNGDVEPFKVM